MLFTRGMRSNFFQAYHILKDLFPPWDTLSADVEICAVCDALIHISKGDKREIRRRVEDEKVRSEKNRSNNAYCSF